MRLEIFQFIDQSAVRLNHNHVLYERAARKLDRFFTDSFSWSDSFLNVSVRIKSEASLREKILRQNLFSRFDTPDEMLSQLSDVIGVRIECRFIAEEAEIHSMLHQLFTDELQDGYFASALNRNISLDLNLEQPQYQKNGFEIYKVDGKIELEQMTIRFELQIKSLVNVFWGEIDHKVLYKNYNYMVTEDFFRDMMVSVKENLWLIDKRLMQMYRHIESADASHPNTTKDQLKAMLSKLIHDTYNQRMREKTGILFDFKKASDLIVDFIFSKYVDEPKDQYATRFVEYLELILNRMRDDIDFTESIEFTEMQYDNPLHEKLASKLLPFINRDFQWYLLFRIMLDIEQIGFEEEYLRFVRYVINTFSYRIKRALCKKEISSNDKETLHKELLERLVDWYSKKLSLSYLTIDNMRALEGLVDEFIAGVNRPEDIWDLDADDFLLALDERFRL